MRKSKKAEVKAEPKKSEKNPNELKVLLRKNMDGEEVWSSEVTDTFDTFRHHRFVVRPKNINPDSSNDEDWKILSNYLLMKSIRFLFDKRLVMTFYLAEHNLDFLIKANYPKKLTIALLSGFGVEKAWIEVSGLKLIENRADSLRLDYASSDILTIDVLFKFRKVDFLRAVPMKKKK